MSEAGASVRLPGYLRRTLGLRVRPTVRFDEAFALRWGDRSLLLTHLDDVRHVLVTRAENYTKTRHLSSARGRLRAGQGLLTSSGEAHHRQRRRLQPLFHPRVLERFLPGIVYRCDRLLKRLEGAAEVDLAREMADLTQAVILDVLFGCGHEDEALARAIRTRRAYTDYVYHGRLPFRTRLPTRIVRAQRKAIRAIDAAIARHIALRRGDPESHSDLLSLLMTARDPEGNVMTDRELRDEVLTFTSTGYETLGEALTWCWFLLAQHPGAEERMVAELVETLGDDVPTPERLEQLAYTRCVLREAMRLYPPTWIFERVPIAADELPSGARVAAGTALYLCPWVLHRHPQHFPEPEAFRPERFAGAKRRPFRYAYLPFGDGVHTCLGENLALLEGVAVLACVGRRFGFDGISPRVVPRAGITLGPRHGLRAIPRAR